MFTACDLVTGVVINVRFPVISLLSLCHTKVQTSCPRASFLLIKSKIIGDAFL
jgi:hypothetical protein